ncbi:Alpha-mannosidase, partial [Caligus rogercresseyi]
MSGVSPGISIPLLLLILTLSSSWAGPSCHPTREGSLNVHLIPHTHDDVGWLKTVDQYYYGSRKSFDPSGVQYILDSVVEALEEDSNRRFIYVEMAFFWRWWEDQSKAMRGVEAGVYNGGWSMNDEAAAHYNAIIDQMSLGLRFINDTFGGSAAPKIAWQIDPFGHAKEQANIFNEMGFCFLDHGNALETRPGSSQLLTGILPNLYQPPKGFCFDVFCGDDALVDNPDSPEYNIPRNEGFSQRNNGRYTDAHMWFKNMDKLMKYFKHDNISLLYSTPSCYAESIQKAMKTKFPGMIRRSNNILQACKQMDVLGNLRSEGHHDAVTGTGKQHVTDDYISRLSVGTDKCFDVMSSAYQKWSHSAQVFCPLLNVSQCHYTTSASRTLSSTSTTHFHSSKLHRILSWKWETLLHILGHALNDLSNPRTRPKNPGRQAYADNEVNVGFEAKNVPPMSFKSYKIQVAKQMSHINKGISASNGIIGGLDFK